jgi:hypothetical protein
MRNELKVMEAYSEVYEAIMQLHISKFLRNFLIYCAGCMKEGSTFEELAKQETATREDLMHWLSEDEGVWAFIFTLPRNCADLEQGLQQHIRNYLMHHELLLEPLRKELQEL